MPIIIDPRERHTGIIDTSTAAKCRWKNDFGGCTCNDGTPCLKVRRDKCRFEAEDAKDEETQKTLTLRMRGKRSDINSFCEAVGSLSNDYNVEIED